VSFADNLARVEEEIAAACRAAGRPRREIELVAVSKVHPTAAIIEAVGLGLRLFGENRVQEYAGKATELAELEARGEFARDGMRALLIGHLQSNKAAKAVEVFDGVDSVDSLKLAERLDEAVARSPKWVGQKLPILLEIKLSHEESKEGLEPDAKELHDLLERLPSLPNLSVQGLMTIAPFGVPEQETRACFRALRELRDKLTQAHPKLSLPVLSMGMSGDFAWAIDEGATRIRIGTALFGKRPGYTA
jgi:pyridoxal phosphate enzyme (YggS family)